MKRSPYFLFAVALATASLSAAPALATDEVPAPPDPPASVTPAPPATGGFGACKDTSKPTSRISTSSSSAGRSRVVRGTASDRGCGASGRGSVARVRISVLRKSGKRCQFMSSNGRLGQAKSCSSATWLKAKGGSRWSFALPRSLRQGSYTIRVAALDSAGNVGSQKSMRVRVR